MAAPGARHPARYPGRAPIEAYGDGGFRFAGMSHKGSILCLPDGIEAWDTPSVAELTLASLSRIIEERERIGFLLLGTGRTQVYPSLAIQRAFAAAGLGLDPMSTGAAARTYNVLLAEGRPVAAALIAVD